MTMETDRVRRHTARAVLARIDDTTVARLRKYAKASPEASARRLTQLDREWDVDRVIETEAAATGLLGLALGAFVRPQLLALPSIVACAVLLYSLTGRYPLLPLIRRLGFRTAREIQRERYAVKALRGDFAGLDSPIEAHVAARASRSMASAESSRDPDPNGPTAMH